MSRTAKIVLGIVVAVVVMCVMLVVGVVAVIGTEGSIGAGGKIGVMHLSGVVSASADAYSLTGTQGIDPEWTAEALRKADRDDSIDAVLLRVNSPGGSPAASWEIYQAVKDMSKPVVVSVGDVAASGAYYFSSAADIIVAAPSSQVGSIGVILAAVDLEELLDKVGIEYTVLTRGEYKDLGHFSRDITPEEEDILNEQMDLIYRQFIRDVADARSGLTEAEVEALANGLSFPGEEALRKGLVDRTGSYRDALEAAAELSGLEPDSYTVKSLDQDRDQSLLGLLFGLSEEGGLDQLVRRVLGIAELGGSFAGVPVFR